MDCDCAKEIAAQAGQGWSSFQIGTFTVVGYLLYRFSQTLPFLIRWPIRLFCSLTGLSALWSWVGRLVRTIKGIRNFYRLLSRMWRFIVRISHKYPWLGAVIRAITGSSEDDAQSSAELGLRLILLGPTGGGQTSVAQTLLGITERKSPLTAVVESTKLSAVVSGSEVTLINSPDLLGPSLGNHRRAREALRSLLLVSPGPHAILVAVEAPGSISKESNQDPTRAIQGTVELFGDEVRSYVIPVLTHAGRQQTVDELLDQDSSGDLRRAVTLCGQMPELVDVRSDCPLEAQKVTRRQLLGRVTEMKKSRGHFVHEVQRREEKFREELLTDMSSSLADRLGP